MADRTRKSRPSTPKLAGRRLLREFGVHPEDPEAITLDLRGARALCVATNHGVLDIGVPTGVFASELTVPYYVFLDAGTHAVTIFAAAGPNTNTLEARWATGDAVTELVTTIPFRASDFDLERPEAKTAGAARPLGEAVAISLLRDQAHLYNENYTGFTFTGFNGNTITV